MNLMNPEAKVYGISVARTYEAEHPVLKSDKGIPNQYLNKENDFSNLVLNEKFLHVGYSKSYPEELKTVQECIILRWSDYRPYLYRKSILGKDL